MGSVHADGDDGFHDACVGAWILHRLPGYSEPDREHGYDADRCCRRFSYECLPAEGDGCGMTYFKDAVEVLQLKEKAISVNQSSFVICLFILQYFNDE